MPCAGFPNPLCEGGKMDRLSCFTKLGMNITICTIPLQPITVGFSQSPSYAAYNSGVQPLPLQPITGGGGRYVVEVGNYYWSGIGFEEVDVVEVGNFRTLMSPKKVTDAARGF